MRSKIILIFVFLSYLLTYSREIIENKLEPAIIEVQYERIKSLDTIVGINDYKIDILNLCVGLSNSSFFSAERKYSDSIEYWHPEIVADRYRDRELSKRISHLPKENIFKLYDLGKIVVHDRFDLTNWLIEEELERPQWIICDSINNILGYECIMAKTDFRGRCWIVWFAPDIPISDGPWKLWGLPGLILKANDAKKQYEFNALSMRSTGLGNVEYFDYDAGNRINISREKALPKKWKYLHTDVHYLIVSSGMYGMNNPSLKKQENIPHTNYDFEETDYLHE